MNYAFADDPPILTRGKNRRSAGGRNFQGRGGSAGQASSLSARARQQPQQTNFSFGDSGAPAGAHRSNRDDASCAGSLEYSASSSVLSSDASGENRFDQILKDFDSELATEIATRAAAERTSRSAAVEGWKQRLESRQQQAGVAATSQQRMQTNRQAQQTQGKRGQPQSQPQQSQFTMATSSQGVPSNPNVTFNYSHSRDNSSEGSDVFGEDFFDESLFDTISRYDNDKEVQETHVPRHVPASSKPKARTPAAGDPFRGQDPFRNTDPFQTSSARGRANMGHVTPPPHTGLKLGAGSNVASVSPTDSRHSRSSSDASWETPVPNSPNTNLGGSRMPSARPPSARPATTSRTKRNESRGNPRASPTNTGDAFYSKPWMEEFPDSFDFDSHAFPTP
mmetsp:Transcript_1327/g.2859  ORF Transcript_1327/g.2859 Transcript_1327/m.2859 type:complete len:394 (-) Transcript_1327:153-1334(-)